MLVNQSELVSAKLVLKKDRIKSQPIQLKILLLTIFLTFCLVMLGAYTRLSDAGLGCPDWPGCYGKLVVPHTSDIHSQSLYPEQLIEPAKAWIEMVHRYLASLVGFLILLLAILTIKNPTKNKKFPFGLLGLVIFQGLLGMWTVTLGLLPIIVTAHLFGGFATLTLLWLYYRDQYATARILSFPPALSRLAQISLLLVIGQIFLGGWTSTNYAALICPDLPMCRGQWLPNTDFINGFNLFGDPSKNWLGGLLDEPSRTAIHLSHRLGACLVSLCLLTLCWQLLKFKQHQYAIAIFSVLLLQISLGVSNILFLLPLPIAVAHNGIAALLLISIADLCWFSRQFQSVSQLKTLPTSRQLSLN